MGKKIITILHLTEPMVKSNHAIHKLCKVAFFKNERLHLRNQHTSCSNQDLVEFSIYIVLFF